MLKRILYHIGIMSSRERDIKRLLYLANKYAGRPKLHPEFKSSLEGLLGSLNLYSGKLRDYFIRQKEAIEQRDIEAYHHFDYP